MMFIEQDIGKEAHIRRAMPLFLTLRDENGQALVTAMLPPSGKKAAAASLSGRAMPIPTPNMRRRSRHWATHFGITLDRTSCYPYRR